MERKNLAKEYVQERLGGRKSGNETSLENEALFTAEDIENAFNAGRVSIVNNIPELTFKDDGNGGYIAETIFDYRYRICTSRVDGVEKYGFSAGLMRPQNYYHKLTGALNGANVHYLDVLKRVLMRDVISKDELDKGLEIKLVPFLNKVRNDEVRNDKFFFNDCGWANGYVAVPPSHPLWGVDYDRANELVSVHGGLTYARPYNERLVSDAILLTDDEIPVDSWIFGFDTMHYGDNAENRNEAFCKAETLYLAEQLKNIKS